MNPMTESIAAGHFCITHESPPTSTAGQTKSKTRKPPKKKPGQAKGPRAIKGEILDVVAAALLLGITDKTIRARRARGLIPFRKWGGRVVFLRSELLQLLKDPPGCSIEEVVENVKRRQG